MIRKQKVCMILIISIFMSMVLSVNAANEESVPPVLQCTISSSQFDKEPYEYPIQPGSDEWERFTTVEQMVEACQIPELKLKSMTTEALVETVLNYPLLLNYTAFNSIETACNIMNSAFNGFAELFSRNDVTQVLLTCYTTANTVEDNTIEVKPIEFFETSAYEFLIACNEIINGSMTVAEMDNFSAIYEQKKEERRESGLYSQASEVYLMYNIQNDSAIVYSQPTYTSVADGTIKTPKGSNVTGVKRCVTDLTASEKASMTEYYDNNYPRATRRGAATGKYNCYSYAWYSRTTSNAYFLVRSSRNAYINDGSYVRYTGTPYSGVIVDYGSTADHAAVCNGSLLADVPYVVSKWGIYGLYEHLLGYCPYAMSGIVPTYTYYKPNY